MVSYDEFRKVGGKVPRELRKEAGRVDKAEVDRLAMRIVGLLGEASSNDARRRALEKARRMLGVR